MCVAHGFSPTDGHRAKSARCPTFTDPKHDINNCDKCKPRSKVPEFKDKNGVTLELHDAVEVYWEKEEWTPGWYYGKLHKILKNDFDIYYVDSDTLSRHPRASWTEKVRKTAPRVGEDA